MRPLLYAAGVYTIVWGLWIGNPFWSVFNQADLYDEMRHFLPEWAWGLNAVVIGSAIIIGVYKGYRRCLLFGCALGVYHWASISILYFIGDWKNTGGITSAAIAVFIYLEWFTWDHHAQGEI